jgi:hypothetical protein
MTFSIGAMSLESLPAHLLHRQFDYHPFKTSTSLPDLHILHQILLWLFPKSMGKAVPIQGLVGFKCLAMKPSGEASPMSPLAPHSRPKSKKIFLTKEAEPRTRESRG